ncbi:hypothetical protein F4212_13005, partial [Candidatus Poribacteria bacterium]|nr:hypothetical protein [Candidatus Poribacteria bacterium]
MATETTQNQDKPNVELILEKMGNLLYNLVNAQNEIWTHIKDGVMDAKEAKNLSPCINNSLKIINACNTYMRRKNIQEQGYDSSVRMSAKRSKEQQQPDQPDQPEDQKPHELQHMHPDMEGYQKALPPPKKEEKVDCVENNESVENVETAEEQETSAEKEPKKVLTKPAPNIITPSKTRPPIITYNPNGFQPYGQMRDLFKSHKPIKMASG